MLSCALDAPLSKIRSPMSAPESVSEPRMVIPAVPVIVMLMIPTEMSANSGMPTMKVPPTAPPALVAKEKVAVEPAAEGTPPDQLAGSVHVPLPEAIQVGIGAVPHLGSKFSAIRSLRYSLFHQVWNKQGQESSAGVAALRTVRLCILTCRESAGRRRSAAIRRVPGSAQSAHWCGVAPQSARPAARLPTRRSSARRADLR